MITLTQLTPYITSIMSYSYLKIISGLSEDINTATFSNIIFSYGTYPKEISMNHLVINTHAKVIWSMFLCGIWLTIM